MKKDLGTQAKRWQYLLDGGVLIDTDSAAIIRLKDGYVVDQHELGDWNLYSDTWIEYNEPIPPPKTVEVTEAMIDELFDDGAIQLSDNLKRYIKQKLFGGEK